MRRLVAIPVVALLAVASCAPEPEDVANGDDPMRALTVSARSTRYDRAYWSGQRRGASAVWHQAASYCRSRGAIEFPNCEPVNENAAAERGNDHADSVLRAVGAAAQPRGQ